MGMVAMVGGSTRLGVGWLYHLFNSAVIGASVGWLLGSRVQGYGSGLVGGAVDGGVWWVLGALMLMPILLGRPAFALLPALPSVAQGGLIGQLIFGLMLGAAFGWRYARCAGRPEAASRQAEGRVRHTELSRPPG